MCKAKIKGEVHSNDCMKYRLIVHGYSCKGRNTCIIHKWYIPAKGQNKDGNMAESM